MVLKKDDDGRRWVELEFLVPGTPEQVWQAIATGPGMSAWFTPTSVDERVGGAIEFNFGSDDCGADDAGSTGVITVWEPPLRLGYEEHGWSGAAPPVATEVVVTSRSGDRCVVRMVHSLFTDRDDWDDELESFETGWPGFFEVLRLYLAHFPGQPAANVRVMTTHPGGTAQAWSTLAPALGLAGVDVGTECETPPGAPRLEGVVQRIHQDAQSREVLLRLTAPVTGVAAIGSFAMGDHARAMVSIYFYGAAAADTAANEQPKWQAWMAQLGMPTAPRPDRARNSVCRLLILLGISVMALAAAPQAQAEFTPWFANSVGGATQVLSVTGTGGSDAKLDVWERTAAGWQPVAGGVGIPAHIGEKGMSPNHFDGSMMTPKGIYTLDFAFGTEPNPGGGLQYVQVGPDHWWDGDMKSPTYNTMQVCKRDECPFNTSLSAGTENLQIPQYAHAVVMGVNKERIPGKGGAFFVHSTDGGATAGCVAIDDAKLVEIMRWLRPGAMIAITE